jgi:hypothetical protein
VTTKELLEQGFPVNCSICEKAVTLEDILPDGTFHERCQTRRLIKTPTFCYREGCTNKMPCPIHESNGG